MPTLQAFVDYLNQQLKPQEIIDYCPNGLQIDGQRDVNILLTGVSANQALIDQAVAHHADALLVHHGFFFKGEPAVITSVRYRRILALMQAGIALLAYHLPLDIHPKWGNNHQLAMQMGWKQSRFFAIGNYPELGCLGRLSEPMDNDRLASHITEVLGREPLLIAGCTEEIRTIAWCTGAAEDGIIQAAAAGAQAYVSGEISERTTALAKELKVSYFACGHHATERYGVWALGEHCAEKFKLQHQFIDIDNPV